MTEELTLRVTDLERKAIAFCREKDVPFPIANYLVDFATEATKELQKDNDACYKENERLVKRFNELSEKNKELEAKNERLAKHILELQKDKGVLTDKVAGLEAQIEKMKCCFNCKHSRLEYEHCRTNKHEKWESAE